MNVSDGFSGLVQFYGLGGPIDVAFYDELDGLGNLVGTISSPGSGPVNETLPQFHSAVFSGTTGARIDVLVGGPPGGPLLLPEPSSLLLLATAALALLVARSRRMV